MSGKTQWDDIQIKLGNMEAPPKELTEDEIFDLIQEAAAFAAEKEKQEKLENASLDDLKEMEDDEDEKVLAEYRKRRLEQMKKEAEANKFGDLVEISEPAYKSEVTEVNGIFVVVHLFKNGIPQCQLINQHLSVLAKKFKATKFVKIRSEEAIHNYPDRNLPTILVYFNGSIVGQIITLSATGGDATTVKDIEWHLSRCGAVKTDLEENPRITAAKNKKTNTSGRRNDSDNEDTYGLLLPLSSTAITGVVYKIARDVFDADKETVGFLMKIHQMSFLFENSSVYYTTLLAVTCLGLIIFGYSMIYNPLFRSPRGVSPLKKPQSAREFHHRYSSIIFILLLFMVLSGWIYRFCRVVFGLSKEQIGWLLKLHHMSYLPNWLSVVWVVFVFLAIFSLILTGLRLFPIINNYFQSSSKYRNKSNRSNSISDSPENNGISSPSQYTRLINEGEENESNQTIIINSSDDLTKDQRIEIDD
eukprot:gene6248-7779_t